MNGPSELKPLEVNTPMLETPKASPVLGNKVFKKIVFSSRDENQAGVDDLDVDDLLDNCSLESFSSVSSKS